MFLLNLHELFLLDLHGHFYCMEFFKKICMGYFKYYVTQKGGGLRFVMIYTKKFDFQNQLFYGKRTRLKWPFLELRNI